MMNIENFRKWLRNRVHNTRYKLIFWYLKTRHYKYYTLNTKYRIAGFYLKELIIVRGGTSWYWNPLYLCTVINCHVEIVKTACHCRRMSLWHYFKQKGPLPDTKGPLARIIPSSAIAEFLFMWQIQLSHKMLVLHWHHGPRLWPRKLDCLIVLISLCRGQFKRLGLTIDT